MSGEALKSSTVDFTLENNKVHGVLKVELHEEKVVVNLTTFDHKKFVGEYKESEKARGQVIYDRLVAGKAEFDQKSSILEGVGFTIHLTVVSSSDLHELRSEVNELRTELKLKSEEIKSLTKLVIELLTEVKGGGREVKAPTLLGSFTDDTKHKRPLLTSGAKIRPHDLISIDGYGQDIAQYAAYFNFQTFQRDNETYRVVTIEHSKAADNTRGLTPEISPLDLKGKNDYESDLSNTRFNWRWFDQSQGVRFRVVTLEDYGSPQSGKGDVQPKDFHWLDHNEDEMGSYLFCWRWFDRDQERYRLLTLE